MSDEKKKQLTSDYGAPVGDNQFSKTVGPNGPVLLEDFHLYEKLTRFDRERIPERVVHARGAGAFGTFKLENSMKQYTKASIFQEEGQETEVLARFSSVAHSKHSPESLRDPRGFSVKFYAEDGNYDLVGNNLPIFFIRDAIKFPDVIHSFKPDPATNVQDPDRYWDFTTQSPEATNMMVWLMSNMGTPAGYQHMQGNSVHAFKWVNHEGDVTYVKYHWSPKKGLKNLTRDQADNMPTKDFNFASTSLWSDIEDGDYPEWELYVQMLSPEDMDKFSFNPLDSTKNWFEEDFPYHKVGTMTLNKNPEDFFAQIEQAAFTPSSMIPGVEASEDQLLQGRLVSYHDTHMHRLGTNYQQIPVNRSKAEVNNYNVDGPMQMSHSPRVNYEPNRYSHTPKEDPQYKESEKHVSAVITRSKIDKPDDFSHAGRHYRSMTEEEKDHLIYNIKTDWEAGVHESTIRLAINNFNQADENLAARLAEAMELNLEEVLQEGYAQK